jgi:N-acetylneuraminic acid mutarotase
VKPPSTLSARRRAVLALLALGVAVSTVLGGGAPVTAAPLSTPSTQKLTPQSSATQKSPHPVRALCPAPRKPTEARCLAWVRTDQASRHTLAASDLAPDGYGPADLASAYELPRGAASGRLVAIVDAYDSPTVEADLAVYRKQYGLPACTVATGCLTKLNQNGKVGPLPVSDPGWAAEIALDVDMVSATCPLCRILLVEASSASSVDLGSAVDTAVAQGAKFVSNSYGLAAEQVDESTLDPYYNHPGVAMTVSSGDTGTGTSYPAASPYVTAVGGTSLVPTTVGRGWTETAWAGGGSGCSLYEPKPSFQTDTGCPRRTEADVSAIADPNTGVAVYDSSGGNGWSVLGGTSVSAPIIAGVYALAGDPAPGSYPNSYPYARSGLLNDVTSGNNGSCTPIYLCAARVGYDGPSGLGTPAGVQAFTSGPQGSIVGTVTDSGRHTPVSGAVVRAGASRTVSDAAGHYRLDLPAGRYAVSVAAYAYRGARRPAVDVADRTRVRADFALTALQSAAVTGTVADGSGHGWPLYAKITVDGASGGPVYSDPFTGRYHLDLPQPGSYSVHVEPIVPGYQTRNLAVQVGTHGLTRDVAVSIDRTVCSPAAGYQTDIAGIRQSFDAGSLPPGWTVTEAPGTTGTWAFNDPAGRGNSTGGSGGFAVLDSDNIGPDLTQDSSLVSPVVDLSRDPAPALTLDSDYRAFVTSTADIDVSVDGGHSWRTVHETTDETISGPLSIPLPQAAHHAAVQVRFRYRGHFDLYWEVDNVVLGHPNCTPIPGGVVAGFTTDANTGTGLNTTSVSGPAPLGDPASAGAGVSGATPEDGAVGDGYYWVFAAAGPHQFTAVHNGYQAVTRTLSVRADTVNRAGFALPSGRLQVIPGSLGRTARLGTTGSRALVLRNLGGVPVRVRLSESAGATAAATPTAVIAGAAPLRVPGRYLPTRNAVPSAARSAAVTGGGPWTDIAEYPVAVSDNAMAYGAGRIYSVGGASDGEVLSAGYVYDSVRLRWAALPELAVARQAPSAAWISGRLIVTGGWQTDGSPAGTTESYTVGARSWRPAAVNPRPHAAAGTAVLNGKLYLVGGCRASDCGSTDVQVYDPVGNHWSSAPNYPGLTSWLACGAVAGKLYCAGGNDSVSGSASGFVFDPKARTWSPIADLPVDTWGAAYTTAGGRLLVSGGAINDGTEATNTGWAYDPATDSWSGLPNAHRATYRLGSACGFVTVGGQDPALGGPSRASEILPGNDACDGTNLPWLALSSTTVTVPPHATVTEHVRLDAASVTTPGIYRGAVDIGTDSPYLVAPVPVAFRVTPPRS